MDDRGALLFEHVSVRFASTEAISTVSLAIPARATLALVGPSGSGKTTLLRVSAAGLAPDEGRILIDGEDPRRLSRSQLRRLRSRIGFIHQRLDLIPSIRVFQNVLLGQIGTLSVAQLVQGSFAPRQGQLEAVHEILERLGIAEKLYARTDTLSGGQLQRVAIARALFQKPTILLADEPISSVDPARARATIELLLSLAEETQCTLIVSMHNFELAAEYFPRLVGLKHGRILFDEPADSLSGEASEQLYSLSSDDLLS